MTSRIGIVIENRLRAKLYDAYLTYPRAFYDRHATGQVLSRATNDLYPIRYFIGWGVVQVCSSAMMIVGVSIVLLSVNVRLALYAGARDAADRAAHVALRAARDAALAHRPAAQGRPHRGRRRVGRRHGDGAGVRARGRGARALPRARRGRAHERAARGGRRGALPARAALPAQHGHRERCSSSAAGRHRGGSHDRRVRALQQPAPAARVAARGARLDPQPRPARGRLGRPHVRLAGRRAAAARGRAPRRSCPTGRSTCASRTSASPTPAARPCSAISTSRSRRARSSPSAARRARASRRC